MVVSHLGSDRLCAMLEEQRIILEQIRPRNTSQLQGASSCCYTCSCCCSRWLTSVSFCCIVSVCAVTVQGWSGQPTVYLRVASYSELVAQVCSVFPTAAAAHTSASSASSITSPQHPMLPSSFTLYYIPAGLPPDTHLSVWFREKKKVDSEAHLRLYLDSFPPKARNPLLLWQPHVVQNPTDAAAAAAPSLAVASSSSVQVPSPTKDEVPVLVVLPQSGPPSLGSPSSVKSGSSRSSTDQKPFAEGVYKRDDQRCVVADCGVSPVQAAHIVPVAEARSPADKKKAKLLSLYEHINGISLCVTCHDYFDAGVSCCLNFSAAYCSLM